MKQFLKSVIYFILQGMVVLLFLFVGNLLSRIISPIILIPGSLLGMILLALLLLLGLLKVKWIKIFSDLMLRHMSFLYVPYGVTILEQLDLIRDIWLPLIIICFITTLLVMFVSASITQYFIKKMEKAQLGGEL